MNSISDTFLVDLVIRIDYINTSTNKGGKPMPLKELRIRSGMSRTQFCEYFEIPYRTVQDWELENRKCPEYLLKLMEYKLKHEGLLKEK
jgi:DNA-binding transcriptional regulator YiaG